VEEIMKTIHEIWDSLKNIEPKRVAVACAADKPVLEACWEAQKRGIAEFILVGDVEKIKMIAGENGISLEHFEFVEETDEVEAGLTAVKLVSSGKADVVMKGLMSSSNFLRACLNREVGIRKEGCTLSAIAVVESAKVDRLLFITDLAITPLPDLETKKRILNNAVEVARKLGIEEPKVACLSGSETVNPKIASSAEGAALQEANRLGEIPNCIVAGPISFDLAMSKEAAVYKKYENPVGGCADILLVPSVDVGNVLYKSITYFTEITTGGVMCGAKAPIVFCSRADSSETKLNTIALAVYLAGKEDY